RHTRFSRDWSSDVCSSDLDPDALVEGERLLLLERGLDLVPGHRGVVFGRDAVARVPVVPGERRLHLRPGQKQLSGLLVHEADAEIGRASCRERVEMSGAAA